MHYYFITNRQDFLTSSIEAAQAKRIGVFQSLNFFAQIISFDYNFDHQEVEAKLNLAGKVINLLPVASCSAWPKLPVAVVTAYFINNTSFYNFLDRKYQYRIMIQCLSRI